MRHPSLIPVLLLLLAAGCAYNHGPAFDPQKDAEAAALRLQESSLTNRLDPLWLKPSTNELTLGPGDRIDIDVFGQGDATASALVCPDGKIYYGLLPGLNVWGLTPTQARDLQHGFLLRQGKFLPVDFNKLIHDGDMSQNIYLEPDDFIFLPSASSSEVYVLGAVMSSRAIAFKDQVTLSSAIANAGGLGPLAYPREVVIVRGSLTQPRFAVVNLLDILKGKAREVLLQPRDIVYVPDKPLEPLREVGQQIVETFVRTVAANEGSRAAGSASKVGVNLNIQ